jgi:predicted O-methyltransferase YrrM
MTSNEQIIYYSTDNNDPVAAAIAATTASDYVSGYGIIELISHIANPIGLEIGTDRGITAKYLLSNRTDLFLHCIDPYINYTDWNGNNLNERSMVQDIMLNNLDQFQNRYTLHKKTSDNAVDDFEDDSFDFIFIDGLHEYNQVLRDCNNYYSKVKTGGLFCGHDYITIAGVNRAVTEFSNGVQKQISRTHNDVWYFYK